MIYLNNTVQEALHRSFQKYSNKIAIEYGHKKVTYSEMDKKSNIIANTIITKGIEKSSIIGIMVEDKIALIITIIGIIKAGCAFMPLDRIYPRKRLEAMLNECKILDVFTDNENYQLLCNIKTTYQRTLKLTKINEDFYKDGSAFEQCKALTNIEPDDLIYIYFTSGTTGKPKAIAGRNKGLLHFIEWEIEEFNIGEGTRVSQFTSQCHDPFLRDVFVPLYIGGTICIPKNREIILDTKSLIKWVEDSGVNIVHCTPGVFRIFNTAELDYKNFKSLKYMFLAGEKMIPKELVNWYDTFGSRIQLVNLYGPTETTLAKMYYLIQPSDVNIKNIPIGKPIRGTKVIILDKDMNICRQGEVGEIFIDTPYRTLGYYNDVHMTSEKFIKNPFSNAPNELIYKTGDLGRVLPNGNIEFLGRIDRQIKIRGYRVELSEIEYALENFKGINGFAVDLKGYVDDKWESEQYLAAYYVSDVEKEEELRNFLEQYLPDYMIPTYFIKLDKLPINFNGKLDYGALPYPKMAIRKTITAPRNEIEEKLYYIWHEILGVDDISVEDSFFKIGGHSLKIMSLMSRIYDVFGIAIPFKETLNNITIEKLAKYILHQITKFGIKVHTEKVYEQQNIEETQNSGKTLEDYTGSTSSIQSTFSARRSLDGIEPFNEIFFKTCFYNALFPVVKYFKGSIITFMTNEIAIYHYDKEKSYIQLDIEYISIIGFEEILHQMGIGVRTKELSQDIISDIKTSISTNMPVVIALDCYYESNRQDMYQKNHWSHYMLIYGYDDSEQVCKAIEHKDANSLSYKKMSISYVDIINSYKGYLDNFQNGQNMPTFYEFFLSEDNEDKNLYKSYEDNSMLAYAKNVLDRKNTILTGLENLKLFIEDFSQAVLSESYIENNVDTL